MSIINNVFPTIVDQKWKIAHAIDGDNNLIDIIPNSVQR